MDGIKHSRQFAEMERLVSDYFHCHLAPVMSKTQAYLTKKQGEEMREYSTSLGGILSAMASAAQPMGDPYQVLKVTGEWNSKTTEDYIGMCKAEITGSKEIQQDLAYMAGQWRDTVVQEIGRKRYDELSEQLGGDLAYAYMDYRVEELMIDRLVKERMPKSSADYIIRKAAESSLLGLSPVCTVAASLRKSANTFRSLPNTPLLMHCSTESVSGFFGSKREATAEIATSAPTNFASVAHEPTPPIITVSAVAPSTRPAPFSHPFGR